MSQDVQCRKYGNTQSYYSHSIWLDVWNQRMSSQGTHPPKRRMKETLFTRHRSTVELMMIAKDRLQTTQPTSGGAVTVVSSCCANCVEPPRPQQWGPDLPFFGHAGHADPLDGWRCCSQKRVVSRPIQVRQL